MSSKNKRLFVAIALSIAVVHGLIVPRLWSSSVIRHHRQPLRPLFSSVPEVGDENLGGSEDYSSSGQFNEFTVGRTEEEEAILEQMREERIISNDRWQSCLLRDNQGGEWTGMYEMFAPTKGPSGLIFRRADTGSARTSLTAGEFSMQGVKIFVQESYTSDPAKNAYNDKLRPEMTPLARSLLLNPTRAEYDTVDFRPNAGNQIVANAFTLSRVEGGQSFTEVVYDKFEEGPVTYTIPEVYVAEVAIREDNIRTRVRFAFSDKSTDAVTPAEANQYDMFLVGINVIRECLTTCSPEEIQPLLTDKMGQGIYDPQQSGDPYVQLNFPGKLSLLFPRALKGTKNAVGNILCIEWQGKSMRFQVDRRFNYLTNGQVRALELTEVRTEDAAKYPPGFRIKQDYEELQ